MNKIDLGVTLNMKLIRSRYVDPDAPLVAPNNILPYSARTSSGREKPIEFWGEMGVRSKQQVKNLADISLRSMGIGQVAQGNEKEELRKQFSHLEELDLAGNLLSDWDSHVLEILRLFPSLKCVSFASNRIQDMPQTLNKWNSTQVTSQLRILNLNKCSIRSFQTLISMDKLCPNLEELYIAYANLSDMAVKADTNDDSATSFDVVGFQKLKLLDCSACHLSQWDDQIRRLRLLPNLHTLILDENKISHICSHQDEIDFLNLSHLQIGGTDIQSWSEIEHLAQFSKLKTLRFRNCPLTNEIGSSEARAQTIARLTTIEILNGSTISCKERLESERRYVSVVAKELVDIAAKLESSEKNNIDERKQKIYKKYPRFEELIAKHKETMLAAQSSSLGFGTISQNAVNITVVSMHPDSCTQEPLQKRLPGNLKIERLKMMCARAFGLNAELQRLDFRAEGDPFPTELDDDENTLSYYGVRDGMEILMNEIDLKAKKREEKNELNLHRLRIDEQEKSSNTLQALQQSKMRTNTASIEKSAVILDQS